LLKRVIAEDARAANGSSPLPPARSSRRRPPYAWRPRFPQPMQSLSAKHV
jgi:hypothetical protein